MLANAGSLADAEDCGTFEVDPARGATGLRPVEYVIVYYATCFTGGVAGVGFIVDDEAPSDHGVSYDPSPPIIGIARQYTRKRLLPGMHTVTATAGEKACADCEWVTRTYEWTFTVGGKGASSRE